jgi:poly-gamma-glutamate synthesis protein (capsule biosynthesis protein)
MLFFIWLAGAGAARAQDTTRVSLLFLGDVMQHDSQIAAARQPESGSYDYTACFQYVESTLKSADLIIGNLEVTLAGPPYKGYPQFSAPDPLALALKNAGVDVLVTANNHSMDRGRQGVERTIDVLDSLAIAHTGTFKDAAQRAQQYPLILQSNGFRLALLNYTYGTNGIPVTAPNVVNLIDTVQIKNDLAQARLAGVDATIVFFHWGSEYQSQPNAWQERLAKLCFREGVMVVVGAHPHVLQPMTWYRERNQLVAYSLGNFVSGQRVRYRDGGAMLHVTLRKVMAPDSTAQVAIEDAAYQLQYVYRDAQKKYFVLPVLEFENDTLVVREAAARDQLRLFAADSRALFNRHNMLVGEMPVPADSNFYCVVSDSLAHVDTDLAKFFEMKFDSVGREWRSAPFFDKETAESAARQLQQQAPQQRFRLVYFSRGRRQEH